MTWKLLGLLLVVLSLQLLVSVLGVLPVVTVGTSWRVALLSLLVLSSLIGGLCLRTHFECSRWTCRVTQPVQRTPLWPASWLPDVDKSRGSKSVEVQKVCEIYDDRLQLVARLDAKCLDDSLGVGDVSRAWLVWSAAAETALADAYRFAGGPVPDRGLIMGGGTARFRVVRLGGPQVRKARGNVADAYEGGDVFMFRETCARCDDS